MTEDDEGSLPNGNHPVSAEPSTTAAGSSNPTPRTKSHKLLVRPQRTLGGLLRLSDMKTVAIDEKGRVVIPKDVRVQSGISTPGQLLLTVEGSGKIGLQSIETNLRRAQEIGRRKLSSWREERHDEDRLALKLTREGKPK